MLLATLFNVSTTRSFLGPNCNCARGRLRPPVYYYCLVSITFHQRSRTSFLLPRSNCINCKRWFSIRGLPQRRKGLPGAIRRNPKRVFVCSCPLFLVKTYIWSPPRFFDSRDSRPCGEYVMDLAQASCDPNKRAMSTAISRGAPADAFLAVPRHSAFQTRLHPHPHTLPQLVTATYGPSNINIPRNPFPGGYSTFSSI